MSQPVPVSSGRRAKRVSRACDYCRRKRLKCTSNQYPCLNCQLYDAECTTHDRERHAPARTARKSDAGGAQDIVQPAGLTPRDTGNQNIGELGDNNNTSTRSHSNNNFDIDLPENQWTQDESIDGSATQDFGHVLRQLGIGVSADFWELEQAMPIDMPPMQIDPGLINTVAADDGSSIYNVDNRGLHGQRQLPGPAGAGSTPRSTANTARGKVSSIESLINDHANAPHMDRSIPPGVFIRKDETVANFIGLNSVGATLALCLKDALESQRMRLSADSLAFLIESSCCDEVGLESLLDLSSRKLPPHDTAIQSIEAYFANLNVYYPIVDEDHFRTRCQMFYTPDRQGLCALDYSLFFLVVSIGATIIMHGLQQSEIIDRVSVDAYEQAWSMLPDSIAAASEGSLQILLLHILRNLYYGRSGIAWVLSGLAIRIAEARGMHRKIPSDMDLPASQLRLRSELWWIMHRLDANLSLSQGRPPALSDIMYDQEMTFATLDADDTSYPRLSQVFTWSSQLSQIQTRFCEEMHSKSSILSRLDAIVRTDEVLSAWKDSLPSTCAPSQHILVSPNRHLHIVLMHLEYFNLVRAVHWSAITLKPTYGGGSIQSSQLTPRIQASEALCVDAARSYIKVLNDTMTDLNGPTVFAVRFQSINYMAAISVLYRSILMAPSSFSARADLEHLRAGKLHLLRDTPSHLIGPALKSLLGNMLSTAQDVVFKSQATIL